MILDDFKNWRVTGFKPWGDSVGGVNHYRSRKIYQDVSQSTFRSQAQKKAKIAQQQMPAHSFEEEEGGNVENVNKRNVPTDKSARLDAESRNPWLRHEDQVNQTEGKCSHDGIESDDEDDENYSCDDEESLSDDCLDGFADIQMGELQNSRAPFISVYPTGDKLLAIFPLDGNVLDNDANRFEFIADNTAIRRLGKVPIEREKCAALIGIGNEKSTKMGFSDIDLMVVDAEIQRRLKANKYKRDEKGSIWEVRATLELPFKCDPQMYGKNGNALTTFRMRSNGRGFSWGYFWLLAWKPPTSIPAKRVGAKLVKIMTQEESSVYTEKTYESQRKS